MVTVVSEPQVGYKIDSWQTQSTVWSFDDFICDIKNEKVILCPPGSLLFMMFPPKRSKRKLSVLRGKMTIQNEKEIDDQIADLRSEWDRNI